MQRFYDKFVNCILTKFFYGFKVFIVNTKLGAIYEQKRETKAR